MMMAEILSHHLFETWIFLEDWRENILSSELKYFSGQMSIIKMYEAEPNRSSGIHFSAVQANYTDPSSEPQDS